MKRILKITLFFAMLLLVHQARPALATESTVLEYHGDGIKLNLTDTSFRRIGSNELIYKSFWLRKMFVIDLYNHVYLPTSFTARYSEGLARKGRVQQFRKKTVRIVLHMRKKTPLSIDSHDGNLLISSKSETIKAIPKDKKSIKERIQKNRKSEGIKKITPEKIETAKKPTDYSKLNLETEVSTVVTTETNVGKNGLEKFNESLKIESTTALTKDVLLTTGVKIKLQEGEDIEIEPLKNTIEIKNDSCEFSFGFNNYFFWGTDVYSFADFTAKDFAGVGLDQNSLYSFGFDASMFIGDFYVLKDTTINLTGTLPRHHILNNDRGLILNLRSPELGIIYEGHTDNDFYLSAFGYFGNRREPFFNENNEFKKLISLGLLSSFREPKTNIILNCEFLWERKESPTILGDWNDRDSVKGLVGASGSFKKFDWRLQVGQSFALNNNEFSIEPENSTTVLGRLETGFGERLSISFLTLGEMSSEEKNWQWQLSSKYKWDSAALEVGFVQGNYPWDDRDSDKRFFWKFDYIPGIYAFGKKTSTKKIFTTMNDSTSSPENENPDMDVFNSQVEWDTEEPVKEPLVKGLDIGGEIGLEHTLSTRNDSIETKRRAAGLKLKAKWESSDSKIRAVASIDAKLESVRPVNSNDSIDIALGESYFQWSVKNLELKAGKMYKTWGVIDGIRTPLDGINPRNLTIFNPDDDATKLPNYIASLEFFPGNLLSKSTSLELLLVKPEPNEFEWRDNKWSPLTIIGDGLPGYLKEGFNNLKLREEKTEDLEFGARLRWGDFGLSYYHGHERDLHIEKSPLTQGSQSIQLSHPTTEMLMFDWEVAPEKLPIIFRGETGFHQQSCLRKDFSSSQEDMFYVGIGFDYTSENYRIEATLSDNILLGSTEKNSKKNILPGSTDNSLLFVRKHNIALGAKISGKLDDWDLEPSLYLNIDLNKGGIYLGPGLKWNLGQKFGLKKPLAQTNLELRFDYFDGPSKSSLGALKHKKQIYSKISFPF